jgi:hypothetical protein
LGAAPKPPYTGSKLRQRHRRRVGRRGCLSARGFERHQRVGKPAILLGKPVTLLAICARHFRQQLEKARQSVPSVFRKICSTEERLAFRREEHRQRPPAGATRQQRMRRLVNLVEVRPLFAIHLDVDEPRVHDRRDFRVLERFVRHHVTPVAGRIADRQQDRLVLGAGARKRFRAPRIPVDRVVGMLPQIGAGRPGETVAHCVF